MEAVQRLSSRCAALVSPTSAAGCLSSLCGLAHPARQEAATQPAPPHLHECGGQLNLLLICRCAWHSRALKPCVSTSEAGLIAGDIWRPVRRRHLCSCPHITCPTARASQQRGTLWLQPWPPKKHHPPGWPASPRQPPTGALLEQLGHHLLLLLLQVVQELLGHLRRRRVHKLVGWGRMQLGRVWLGSCWCRQAAR